MSATLFNLDIHFIYVDVFHCVGAKNHLDSYVVIARMQIIICLQCKSEAAHCYEGTV